MGKLIVVQHPGKQGSISGDVRGHKPFVTKRYRWLNCQTWRNKEVPLPFHDRRHHSRLEDLGAFGEVSAPPYEMIAVIEAPHHPES
jgi:hypothetical protein